MASGHLLFKVVNVAYSLKFVMYFHLTMSMLEDAYLSVCCLRSETSDRVNSNLKAATEKQKALVLEKEHQVTTVGIAIIYNGCHFDLGQVYFYSY